MAKIDKNGQNAENGQFFMAFQIPAWDTRPERPKFAKDEVPRPKGPLDF